MRRTPTLCSVLTSAVFAAALWIPASARAQSSHAQGLNQPMSLAIQGTSITFNAYGIPTHLEGTCTYAGGPRNGHSAGTYSEDVQPIFMVFNGVPMFVGTTGVATFTLDGGTITTHEVSYIVGVSASGLSVVSQGAVASATGRWSNVTGTLASSSTVLLPSMTPNGSFHMDTVLTLDMTRVPGA